ncbi:histidine kinase [Virgisporangium ochraceum]
MVGRFRAVGRRWETLPPTTVDALTAVLCFLMTVAVPVKVPWYGGPSLFVLAALASLPLVWRRRQPVVVAALVGAGTIALAVTDAIRSIPLPYGQLIATYTVAALAGPVWRVLTMVCTAIGVLVTVLVVLDLGVGPAAVGTAALPFVVAYALGVGVRARRDRISMLEERTRRLAEAQEATAARERERIAREIHDIVAHSVSLMEVLAEAGIDRAAGQARTTRTFETIAGTGREALSQLDRALGVLRDDGAARRPEPGLDDLPEVLERARLAGLDADLVESGTRPRVPADVAVAVYGPVQEAVTNAVRHADATRLRVALDWRDGALDVRVHDNGRGPAPDTAPGPAPTPTATKRGLIGMRERVHAFGGDLHTGHGDDGTGFVVVARLPITPPRREADPHG